MPRQFVPSYDSQHIASNSQSPHREDSVVWQTSLMELCKRKQYQEPVFNLYSERRGGRTAWSTRVTVQGQSFPARYFYDGNFLNNAREDAAEQAVKFLDIETYRTIAIPS